MLEEIQKLIHEHRRATKSITSDKLGEMVLDRIEELGMVPTQDMYVPYNGKQQLDLIMKAFSWEPEND